VPVNLQVRRGLDPRCHPPSDIGGQRPGHGGRQDVDVVSRVEIDQVQPRLTNSQPGDLAGRDLATLPADHRERSAGLGNRRRGLQEPGIGRGEVSQLLG